VLAVTRDSHLLRFADRVIYIEDGSLKKEETANASVYPHTHRGAGRNADVNDPHKAFRPSH
jgi:hypothetical protein